MTSDSSALDAYGFSSYDGFNAQLVRWRYDVLSRHFHGSSCLELGSSDGQGTEYLLAHFETVVAVDGSPAATTALRERLTDPRLRVVTSTFETLELGRRFDTVVLAHVLEHVDDPAVVLAVAMRHLAPDGVLLVDVPNAESLHRRLGVAMGMLETVTTLNEADHSIGHQRVYRPDEFRAAVRDAGLVEHYFGGVFLKVLSNAQTAEAFDGDQLGGFLALGEQLPELASEIYVVAGLPPAEPPS
jgi:2-polyprenyl-3-methyl-5-hydroxy-6-metoxy-1,4-benzoquinol methylase